MLKRAVIATSFILTWNAVAQTSEPACSVGYSGLQSGYTLQPGKSGSYMLTAKATHELKLADGNSITGYAISHQMRDAQGRTRTESPTGCRIVDGVPQWQGFMTIIDPVEKRTINWQIMNLANYDKIARVIAFVPPAATQIPVRHVAASGSPVKFKRANDDEQRKVEDLGRRSIVGLEAEGTRMTRVVPAGKQGNAQPLAYSEEIWKSTQYGMVLQAVNDDPIFGRASYEVTDFEPIEPDASSFEPPKDYKIEEVHSTPQAR